MQTMQYYLTVSPVLTLIHNGPDLLLKLCIFLFLYFRSNNINYPLKHDMPNTPVHPALKSFQHLLRPLFHETDKFSLPVVLSHFYFSSDFLLFYY